MVQETGCAAPLRRGTAGQNVALTGSLVTYVKLSAEPPEGSPVGIVTF